MTDLRLLDGADGHPGERAGPRVQESRRVARAELTPQDPGEGRQVRRAERAPERQDLVASRRRPVRERDPHPGEGRRARRGSAGSRRRRSPRRRGPSHWGSARRTRAGPSTRAPHRGPRKPGGPRPAHQPANRRIVRSLSGPESPPARSQTWSVEVRSVVPDGFADAKVSGTLPVRTSPSRSPRGDQCKSWSRDASPATISTWRSASRPIQSRDSPGSA